jgi:hypothetical protein
MDAVCGGLGKSQNDFASPTKPSSFEVKAIFNPLNPFEKVIDTASEDKDHSAILWIDGGVPGAGRTT